jgi:hypothetical protein
MSDRAAVVTTAVMEVVARHRRTGTDPRVEIKALLRDEFADVARQTEQDLAGIDTKQ